MKILRIILTSATILMMALIFRFSAQPADDSGEMSTSVGLAVGRIFVPDFEEKTEAEQLLYAQSIDYPVRKCAHASEYAILSALCICTLLSWSCDRKPQQTDDNKYRPSSTSVKNVNKPAALVTIFGKKLKLKAAISMIVCGWLIATFYAATDEFHQLFVDGRACMFTDVMIDSAGAAFAAVIILLIVLNAACRRHSLQRKSISS